MQHQAIEIGMFKLKDGVALDQAIDAYKTMIQDFLSLQMGWKSQSLVILEDQTLLDLAWSENITNAKAICSMWESNEYCQKFLSMIDPISIQFGQILSTHSDI